MGCWGQATKMQSLPVLVPTSLLPPRDVLERTKVVKEDEAERQEQCMMWKTPLLLTEPQEGCSSSLVVRTGHIWTLKHGWLWEGRHHQSSWTTDTQRLKITCSSPNDWGNTWQNGTWIFKQNRIPHFAFKFQNLELRAQFKHSDDTGALGWIAGSFPSSVQWLSQHHSKDQVPSSLIKPLGCRKTLFLLIVSWLSPKGNNGRTGS